MKTKVILDLEVGLYNGKGFTIAVKDSSKVLLDATTLTNTKTSLQFELDLPQTLVINLSGRSSQDIEVDQDYNVIQEKSICLQSIRIWDTEVPAYRLSNVMLYHDSHGNQRLPNFFWNSNGTVTIEIGHQDPLVWLIQHQELW